MSSPQSQDIPVSAREKFAAGLRYLTCPLDAKPLTQLGNSLCCADGHSFDIARQGYANLLPVQNKRSRDPGDSREMVAARQRFLSAGHYQSIADAVAGAVLAALPKVSMASCLDAGCGEGYYLRALHSMVTEGGADSIDLVGVDISKWAIQAAAKSELDATWVVASNARLPIVSSSIDAVLCMFGFPVLDEFSRILKESGVLILVEAGPNHLIELRDIIYAANKHADGDEKPSLSGFSRYATLSVTDQISLNSKSAIADLLTMTPHMYRANAQGRSAALALLQLTLTVDVSISCWRKTPANTQS